MVVGTHRPIGSVGVVGTGFIGSGIEAVARAGPAVNGRKTGRGSDDHAPAREAATA
jgi:hypothetical protein